MQQATEGAVVVGPGRHMAWLQRGLQPLGIVLMMAVGLGLIYHETLWSMIAIWTRSENFAHGFLIAPISIWLIWEKREAIALCTLEGAWLPVWLMLPVGVVWVLGSLVDVLVVQQFAFVGMLVLGIWAVIGTPMARLLAFPLGFLFFGVPVGEGLVYPLMTFTADFTVYLLRATGIPVYREGTFFSIPSGDWSVVEACSGVRYLTASVTLGVLYAYLTYTRLWKRLVFVLFAIIVPVVGNGVRAYLIVMLGHLSNMRLAVGVDHLVYGWVFFGLIVFVLFYVGSLWRDAPEPAAFGPPNGAARSNRGALVGIVAIAASAIGPVLAWGAAHLVDAGLVVGLKAPAGAGGWTAAAGSLGDWRPRVVGPDGQAYQLYRAQGAMVGLYIGVYGFQREGAELVSSAHQMVVQKHPVWSDKAIRHRTVDLKDGAVTVEEHELIRRTGERLLVWNWYQIGDWDGVNPYLAKLVEIQQRVFWGRSDGALVAVAAPYLESKSAAEEVLQEFVQDMLPMIRQAARDGVARQ